MRKIVVFVPADNAAELREAIGEIGGGTLGHYSHCSFSSRGIGRFKPEKGSNPSRGVIGKLEEVEEERIEFLCSENKSEAIIAKIKEVHPYEEPAIESYSIDLH